MNDLHIFVSALEIDSRAERNRYLDIACGDDHDLRRRIDELLRSYEEAGDFMQATHAIVGAAINRAPPA